MDKLLTLILLAIIGYFTFKSRFKAIDKPESRNSDAAPDAPKPSDAADMAQDPVCGTYVETGSEYNALVDGKKVYFCSEECKEKFLGRNG